MITRIWHGWTTPDNADRYEALLLGTVFPAIAAKQLAGYRGIRLLRRDAGTEVEFVTIMTFDSIESIRAFAGDDSERAYVPDAARQLLARFDDRARHYQVRAERDQA